MGEGGAWARGHVLGDRHFRSLSVDWRRVTVGNKNFSPMRRIYGSYVGHGRGLYTTDRCAIGKGISAILYDAAEARDVLAEGGICAPPSFITRGTTAGPPRQPSGEYAANRTRARRIAVVRISSCVIWIAQIVYSILGTLGSRLRVLAPAMGDGRYIANAGDYLYSHRLE